MTDAIHGQLQAGPAEVYEAFFVPALFAQWPPLLLDAAGVGEGDRVLDVGCGTGVATRAAARRVGAGGSVVGLDPNEAMLTVARRSSEPITWRQGSVEQIPFDDGSFDRVVSQFAMMFVDDLELAGREMARVLADGGRLAIATWASVDHSPGYTAMVGLLRRHVGPEAAEALLAPFRLGEPGLLAEPLGTCFGDVEVTMRHGTARFESLESWMHTDIRGWTLDDMIDDECYVRLLDAARTELARFVRADGTIEFDAPALIATASA